MMCLFSGTPWRFQYTWITSRNHASGTPWRVTSARKINTFINWTCLNIKHQRFIFQHIVHIYLNTYWHTPVRPYERQ